MPKERTKKILKIVVFSDGRPGHEKQTVGLVDALKRKTDVCDHCIVLKRESFLERLAFILGLFLPVTNRYKSVLRTADYLICAGRTTHVPALLSKLVFSKPVIVCMSPSWLVRHFFDLCLVPRHDAIKDNDTILRTFGPPNRSVNKKNHDSNKKLIVVGGTDDASHFWDNDQIAGMVETLLKKEPKTSWTITTSPRTPPELEPVLKTLVTTYSNVRFCPFSETSRGWIEQEYDRNKVVWVTGDSISMVYEALTAGCSVGILPVNWKKKARKFIKNETELVNAGLVLPYQEWLDGKNFPETSASFNEADRCAEYILEKQKP